LSDTDGHAALRAYCSNKGKRRKLEQGEMEMDEDYARRVREERSLPLAEVLAKSVRAKVDAVVAYQRATLQLGPSKPRQFDLETEQITEEENELFQAWQAANNDVMDTTNMYTDDIKVLNDEIEDLYAQVADVVDAAGLGANEVRSYRAEEADAIVTLARNVKRKPPRHLGITACYDLVLAPLAALLAEGAEGQDVEEVLVDASARDWQADYAAIFAQYCSPEFLQAWAAEVGAAIEERVQQREEYTQVEASIAYDPRPDDGVAEEE
jgi:NTP pyrophosphatase (non-canonical NTP hydrolase)